MLESVKIKWFYALSLLYILVCAILIYFEIFYLFLLPAAIAIIIFSLVSIDKLAMFIAFCVPLSINLEEVDIGFAISMPAEPLMIGAMLVFIFKVLAENSFDKRIWTHPVTWAVCFYLGWGFFTSFTSQLPLVSFKYMLSKCWFIIPFYFLGIHIFKDKRNITRFPWMYMLGLAIVIIYTTYNHYLWQFEKQPAHWVMDPFYYDHTIYGCMIAFFVPFIVGYTFINYHSLFIKIFVVIIFIIIMIGLYLSASRAAWLSVVGAAALWLVFLFRIKWYVLVGFSSVIAFFLWVNWTDIVIKLEKNKQDSSEDFSEHIQSMSNISSDASNLERLLRWNCAIRMYNERPITGWGPGTYMFVYAPFQKSYELTIISTNFGDGGNAHSEYLGPLSEQGIFGLVAIIFVIATTFYTGTRVIFSDAPKRIRQLATMILLGLVTYWIHSLLNNFLDQDKAAVPYWGFVAILVAMDLYYVKFPSKSTNR